MDELEKAHKDYEERKEKIIHNLEILYDNTLNMTNQQILKKLSNSLKKGKSNDH